MTYEEFKNKHYKEYIDVDNYPKDWPYQCFDLVQLYFGEVLGVPEWVLGGCYYVKNMLYGEERKQLDMYFDEIDTNHMIAGDVCIWDSGQIGGEAGHIAIYDHYDDSGVYFFSQNPNASEVIQISMVNMHPFRRKSEAPPKPEITPNVERDEYKNQIEVKVDNLRVRTSPSLNGEILGYATKGFYNYYQTAINDDYGWYRISENQWVADDKEWLNVYEAKQKEYKKLEVLDKKDGYVLVDLGKVYIKEDEA